jgi:hypothetical protein
MIMPGSFGAGSNLPQLAGGAANPAAAFVTGLGAAVKLWLRADTNVVASTGVATQITDKSATAAVLSGSVALVPSVFGSFPALQSSGTNLNSAADVAAMEWDFTQPFSVMLAMKRTAAPANPYGFVIGHWADGGNYPGWWASLSDKPKLQLTNQISGPYCAYTGPASLGSSGAHTVVMTYDGSGHPAGIRIYVDGVQQSGGFAEDFLAGDSIVASGQKVNFFGSNSGSYCNDQIAEIVVANLEFTSAQAAAADAYLNGQYAIH